MSEANRGLQVVLQVLARLASADLSDQVILVEHHATAFGRGAGSPRS